MRRRKRKALRLERMSFTNRKRDDDEKDCEEEEEKTSRFRVL
jgi:hypothetical protein